MNIPPPTAPENPSRPISLLAEARATVKKLLDRVSLVALSLGLVSTAASMLRIRTEGMIPNVVVDMFFYPAIALVIIFRKKLKDTTALALLVAITTINALLNFVTLGLASVSFLILATCAIITLTVFSRRAGYWYLGGSIVMVGLVWLGHVLDLYPDVSLSPGYMDAPGTWVMQVATYMVFTIIMLVTVDNIQNRLAGVLNRQARQSVELAEREEKYRLLAENMRDVVFVQDMDMNITYCSPSVEQVFGYTPEEACRRPMHEMMTPESVERARKTFGEAVQRAMAGDRSEVPEMAFEYIRKDGSIFTGAIRPSFLYDANGNLAGTQGIMMDITERKKAERDLRESEEKFRTAVESLPFEFFTIRPDGRYGMQNGLCRRNWGDVTDLLPEDVAPDKDTLALWKANNERALAGEVVTTEMRFAHGGKDGTYLNIISPVLYDGRPNGVLGINIDITEQRRAESDLHAALDEKDVLLRELYHRTKNNMQVIHSMLSLQAKGTDDPVVLDMFKDIQGRIQAMSLVHQKLYTSQTLSQIDLAEYVRELFALLGRGYRDKASQTTLCLDSDALPVSIDIAVPCGLILNELITNSFKYAFPDGEAGQVTVKIQRDGDGYMVLEYADNGKGVPDGFDFRNTGTLGMQVVQGIAEHQLQGSVAFSSGNGLTCTIRFRDSLYTERV